MLGWLFNILVGSFCVHKWEVIKEGPRLNSRKETEGYYYDLRCTKCGNIKCKNT